jgi:hypothetical protein
MNEHILDLQRRKKYVLIVFLLIHSLASLNICSFRTKKKTRNKRMILSEYEYDDKMMVNRGQIKYSYFYEEIYSFCLLYLHHYSMYFSF